MKYYSFTIQLSLDHTLCSFAAPNGNDEDVSGKYRHFFGGFGDSIT